MTLLSDLFNEDFKIQNIKLPEHIIVLYSVKNTISDCTFHKIHPILMEIKIIIKEKIFEEF